METPSQNIPSEEEFGVGKATCLPTRFFEFCRKLSMTKTIYTVLLSITLIHVLIGVVRANEPPWQLVGQRDIYRIVLVNNDHVASTDTYWSAIKGICVNRRACNIAFFSSTRPPLSVGAGRLTQEDIDQTLLIYTINKGFEWNCKFRPDADNCFER